MFASTVPALVSMIIAFMSVIIFAITCVIVTFMLVGFTILVRVTMIVIVRLSL
ncbi:hypothetical protein [Hyphomonas sp.]|uniref:hypothetical protein n=1 Tax=Hyphomonas sp. TaxID=87 RepID=UPI0025BD4D98|nr:hypothetical protein [Hyphomonas sp.]